MPEQFENGRKFDGKNSLQDFDVKEMYIHPKNPSVSFQQRLKMFFFHHFQAFTRCRFQNVLVGVPFSKSTVFKICRQNICRFRVNGRPIRRIFHRFQNLPASCERSLRLPFFFDFKHHIISLENPRLHKSRVCPTGFGATFCGRVCFDLLAARISFVSNR